MLGKHFIFKQKKIRIMYRLKIWIGYVFSSYIDLKNTKG